MTSGRKTNLLPDVTQVHVDKCVSKNVFIGVAMKRAALANYVGSDLFGWGYLANKAVWHNRGKVQYKGVGCDCILDLRCFL